MDAARFDVVTRVFAAPRSRRATLGALLAGFFPSLGTRAAPEAAHCLRNGRPCGKRQKRGGKKRPKNKSQPCTACCSRYAVKRGKVRRCRCRPDGRPCRDNVQCCSGRCAGGRCRTCDVCATGCAFSSLQAAVDAAQAGDIIRLCPGSYRHTSVTKSLWLLGSGGGNTILDGAGLATNVPVLRISPNVAVLVRGLTVTGGNNSTGTGDGGGILNFGALTLDGVAVTANTSAGSGGGIAVAVNGTLTLVNSSVTGNTAATDFGGGIAISSGAVTIAGSNVTGNTAGNQGGGIWTFSAPIAIDAGSRVTGNTANGGAGSGGGIFNDSSATVTLASAAIVTGNTPDNCGGDAVANCVNP